MTSYASPYVETSKDILRSLGEGEKVSKVCPPKFYTNKEDVDPEINSG